MKHAVKLTKKEKIMLNFILEQHADSIDDIREQLEEDLPGGDLHYCEYVKLHKKLIKAFKL